METIFVFGFLLKGSVKPVQIQADGAFDKHAYNCSVGYGVLLSETSGS